MPNILWVDDEIEMLKGHLLFLEGKGYSVATCNNGADALDLVQETGFDAVFLDENMPGLSGLETLEKIKDLLPELPVVMITKSEEEQIMEMAIGSKIADYLIKPVNPNQVLLSLKKILDGKQLVSQAATRGYQQEFGRLTLDMQQLRTWEEWANFYKKLLQWELKLDESPEEGLKGVLATQKKEANELFARFIANHYKQWFSESERPMLSHELVGKVVAPQLRDGKKVFFLVMDNLRYDQWLAIKPLLSPYFHQKEEGLYNSILPSATQYARNALFAGMMPASIKASLPQYWVEEHEEGSKNQYEGELLEAQLERLGLGDKKSVYQKVTNLRGANKLYDTIHQHKNADVFTVVYNFVDALSHAKTDTEVVRELASDDSAYRRLVKTWLEGSPLLKMLQWASQQGFTVVLTTDHGTVNVHRPSKVVGTKHLTTNLRYKTGNGMSYQSKHSFVVKDPSSIGLPKQHIADEYIFALSDLFYVYPNRYNHFVQYYRNTYQHGGVSLEELIIPYAVLTSK
jgi:DNA-binding response OmpR family regulator